MAAEDPSHGPSSHSTLDRIGLIAGFVVSLAALGTSIVSCHAAASAQDTANQLSAENVQLSADSNRLTRLSQEAVLSLQASPTIRSKDALTDIVAVTLIDASSSPADNVRFGLESEPGFHITDPAHQQCPPEARTFPGTPDGSAIGNTFPFNGSVVVDLAKLPAGTDPSKVLILYADWTNVDTTTKSSCFDISTDKGIGGLLIDGLPSDLFSGNGMALPTAPAHTNAPTTIPNTPLGGSPSG